MSENKFEGSKTWKSFFEIAGNIDGKKKGFFEKLFKK